MIFTTISPSPTLSSTKYITYKYELLQNLFTVCYLQTALKNEFKVHDCKLVVGWSLGVTPLTVLGEIATEVQSRLSTGVIFQ